MAGVRMIRTLVILEHDLDGPLKREVFHPGMTAIEMRCLIWETIKDVTPGVRK